MSAPPRVRGVRNRLAYAEGKLLDERIVPGSVTARHARLGEPHVAELNRWARDVAAAERRRVPFVDPESGSGDGERDLERVWPDFIAPVSRAPGVLREHSSRMRGGASTAPICSAERNASPLS